MDVSSGAAVSALLLNDHDRQESNDDQIQKQNQQKTLQSPFRVLDLCCAPGKHFVMSIDFYFCHASTILLILYIFLGLKTCTIVDLLSNNKNIIKEKLTQLREVHVIGVDISEQRLQLCKNIIKKYHINKTTSGSTIDTINSSVKSRISLYCTDGRKFGTNKFDPSTLIFDSMIAMEEECQKGERKRMNKSARARQKKKLKTLAHEEIQNLPIKHKENQTKDENIVTIPKFDRVLVDAECSTDGAVRHMLHKHNNNDISFTENQKLTDSKKLIELVALQKDLINSGFRLLKPGGILVYSTCSLSNEQNEDVVSWLLQQYEREAFLIPVSFADEVRDSNQTLDMIYEGSLNGTVRFHPNVNVKPCENEPNFSNNTNLFGGGFFLAKIGKCGLQ